MQAVIDACEQGLLAAQVRLVISNNSDSGALKRAEKHGIAALHMSRVTHGDASNLDLAMARTLREAEVNLVVLAGYMRPVGPATLRAFSGRLVNCHPALLPKYGGVGFYGRKVHASVLAAGDKETGSTIHYVDELYDHGPIICQNRVPVRATDTAESLENRVKAAEHQLLVEAIGLVCNT